MASFWPWLVVAGIGALHGLNPAGGWLIVAAWAWRSGDAARPLRALGPIAIGHAVAVLGVAAVVALGAALDVLVDRGAWQATALALAGASGLLLAGVAVARSRGATGCLPRPPGARAGLALWSFVVANVHGAGWMLVPALVPLCLSDGPAREITASGSLALALAAVGVHMAAMLATTGAAAWAACRGMSFAKRRFRDREGDGDRNHENALQATGPRNCSRSAVFSTLP